MCPDFPSPVFLCLAAAKLASGPASSPHLSHTHRALGLCCWVIIPKSTKCHISLCRMYRGACSAQNVTASLSGKVCGMDSTLQKYFSCWHSQLKLLIFLKHAGNHEGEWVVGVLCSAPRVCLALYKLSVICHCWVKKQNLSTAGLKRFMARVISAELQALMSHLNV